MNTNYEATNAHIIHNGHKYYLLENAHCDVPSGVDYQWTATAENFDGDRIQLTWQQKDNYDETDDSEACDWDKYGVIEL